MLLKSPTRNTLDTKLTPADSEQDRLPSSPATMNLQTLGRTLAERCRCGRSPVLCTPVATSRTEHVTTYPRRGFDLSSAADRQLPLELSRRTSHRRYNAGPRLAAKLARAVYGGVPIADAIRGQISAAVSRFRTVESISPRCLTGGGIRLLFGGLFRDEYPARKHVVTVKFGRHRRLEIG